MSQLTDVLEEFRGKSVDEIAEMVRRRGIKGRMGTTYGCPMALLLKGTHSGQYIIGRRYIVRRSGDVIQKARTPDNVNTFVRRFDIGKYPELMAPPPRCLAKPGDAKRHGKSGRHKAPRTPRAPVKHHLAKLVGRFHEGQGAA